MKFATVLTLALSLFLVSACGGDYQAPPKSNTKPAPGNTTPAPNPGKQPTGPSMETDYTDAAKAAFAARDAYKADKTAENFAKWGAHIYEALRFSIEHDRNGRSTDGFYKFKELREMKTDFTKTIGPAGWEEIREYQTAKKAYNDVQG
ncbi:MAG: hypothetical protein R3E76_09470 [Planctomycetota bacterium]